MRALSVSRLTAAALALVAAWPAAASAAGPPAPTGVLTTLVTGDRVVLRWQKVAGEGISYRVEHRPRPGAEAPGGAGAPEGGEAGAAPEGAGGEWHTRDVGGERTGHAVLGLSEGTAYEVRVRACAGGECGPPSRVLTVTTRRRPSAPTHLAASEITYRRVALSWRDTSGDEERFEVLWQHPGEEDWRIRTQLGADRTHLVVQGLRAGSSYRFRVRACNLAGCSEASAPVAVTTPALPADPGSL